MDARVLLVEPDPALCAAMRRHLSFEGDITETARDVPAALAACAEQPFDLVVVDLEIPRVSSSGVGVCRRLRAEALKPWTPLLVIAPPARQHEALSALEQCADDSLTVPFGMREFIARARALMRRADARRHAVPGRPAPPALVRDGLVIDPARRLVHVAGRDVQLTVNEFELLYTLAARADIVFSREALLADVWGPHTFVTARSVDALVKRVRRQLNAAAPGLDFIVTVRGAGYKFEEPRAGRTRGSDGGDPALH